MFARMLSHSRLRNGTGIHCFHCHSVEMNDGFIFRGLLDEICWWIRNKIPLYHSHYAIYALSKNLTF